MAAWRAAPWSASWPTLRFLAGVASAFVFVQTSGWCLARLAAAGLPAWGGLIYIGPGLGIALSGLAASAMVAHGWPAAQGWAVFGGLALLLTAGVWRIFTGPAAGVVRWTDEDNEVIGPCGAEPAERRRQPPAHRAGPGAVASRLAVPFHSTSCRSLSCDPCFAPRP